MSETISDGVNRLFLYVLSVDPVGPEKNARIVIKWTSYRTV